MPGTLPLVGGRYQLMRPLNSGAEGDVYIAVDTHERDQVAIKLLKAMPPGREWLEATILRHLTDDHILPIRNADQDLGQAYLVTEVAVGGSLDALLGSTDGCGLPVDVVVRLVRQACVGVARAHDRRLIHNDIKPANLFLNAEQECLVGDFGLATFLPPGAASCHPMGFSMETVAPEVAAAELFTPVPPSASVQSDIYSLGATAYMLLAAQPRVGLAGSATDVLARIAVEEPVRLWDLAPHVPGGVQSAIERAMSRNPTDRHPHVMSFANDLAATATPARRWRRTDEHVGHEACWRGDRPGRRSANVCLQAGSSDTHVVVTTAHADTGRNIKSGQRSGYRRTWANLVRSAMKAVA